MHKRLAEEELARAGDLIRVKRPLDCWFFDTAVIHFKFKLGRRDGGLYGGRVFAALGGGGGGGGGGCDAFMNRFLQLLGGGCDGGDILVLEKKRA